MCFYNTKNYCQDLFFLVEVHSVFADSYDCLFIDAIAFFGFLGQVGSSPQPWSALLACQDTKVLGLQERFIPLSLKEYSCPPQKDHPTRMDIELLRKSLSQK